MTDDIELRRRKIPSLPGYEMDSDGRIYRVTMVKPKVHSDNDVVYVKGPGGWTNRGVSGLWSETYPDRPVRLLAPEVPGLTEIQVAAIRRMLLGGIDADMLAEHYGVDRKTIEMCKYQQKS
jgi:hypothetical protein